MSKPFFTFRQWKTNNDRLIDQRFLNWLSENGISPIMPFTQTIWAAMWEAFLNDLLDNRISEDPYGIDDII